MQFKNFQPCFARIPNLCYTIHNAVWLHSLKNYPTIFTASMWWNPIDIKVHTIFFVNYSMFGTSLKKLESKDKLCIATHQQCMTRYNLVSIARTSTLPASISTCNNSNSIIISFCNCSINFFLKFFAALLCKIGLDCP